MLDMDGYHLQKYGVLFTTMNHVTSVAKSLGRKKDTYAKQDFYSIIAITWDKFCFVVEQQPLLPTLLLGYFDNNNVLLR